MIFRTENLILRPWQESDKQDLYNLAKNPNIGPIAGWPPHESVEDSLEIIKTVFAKKETYAIALKSDNKAIGSAGLLIHPDGNHYWGDDCGELGYWIGEPYWGRGLVVEACKPLLEHGFNDLKLKKIYATYNVNNYQSKRVLEKLGFKYFDKLFNIDYKGEEFLEIGVVLENPLF